MTVERIVDRKLNLFRMFTVQVGYHIYGLTARVNSATLVQISNLVSNKIKLSNMAAPLVSRGSPSLANFSNLFLISKGMKNEFK